MWWSPTWSCTPAHHTEEKAALDWFIPSAYAHVPESATRLGTPTLDDMLGETGRARIVGEIAPPFGEYCSVRVVVAPADEDVVNLSELPPDELTGHSAIVRGRWRQKQDDEQAWHSFTHRLSSVSARHVMLPEPILLDPSHDSAFVLVDSTIDGALADALGDWITSSGAETPDEEAIARKILDLVGDTQRRYTSPRASQAN